MAHRITGNVGVAGIKVFWLNETDFTGTFTVSNNLGDYDTGSVLSDAIYAIIPVKEGWTFTPRYLEPVISGAGVNGVNFSSPVQLVDRFIFTQLFEDTFQRPDESPLDPTSWTNAFAPDVTQIVSHECVINLTPANVGQDSDCKNIARDWTPTTDQYIEVTLQDFSIGVAYLYIRSGHIGVDSDRTTPTYRLGISLGADIASLDFTTLSLCWRVDTVDATGGSIPYVWNNFDTISQPFTSIQIGDRIGFGIIGDNVTGHLYVFFNRTPIWKGKLSEAFLLGSPSFFLTSGAPGFQLASAASSGFRSPDPPQAINDIGINNLKAGRLTLNNMSLIYTQLVQDTFQRPNENPLNPANWTTVLGEADLQIVSHECEASVLSGVNNCAANYTGTSWPNDQYIDITVQTISNSAAVGGVLRSDTHQIQCYELVMFDIGGGDITIEVIEAASSTVLFLIASTPFVAGTVFRFSTVGTLISLFQNGTLIGSATDATHASGFAGLIEAPSGSLADAQISNFAGGSVTSGTITPNIINNSVPRPVIIFGRAPNGQMQAVTTDGSGNLRAGGSTSSVDVINNSIANPVMIYGQSTVDGTLVAVTTDGTGKLS